MVKLQAKGLWLEQNATLFSRNVQCESEHLGKKYEVAHRASLLTMVNNKANALIYALCAEIELSRKIVGLQPAKTRAKLDLPAKE